MKLTLIELAPSKIKEPPEYHYDISNDNKEGLDNDQLSKILDMLEEMRQECLNLESRNLGLELAEKCNDIRRTIESKYSLNVSHMKKR